MMITNIENDDMLFFILYYKLIIKFNNCHASYYHCFILKKCDNDGAG